jgi:hypothetical protein
MRLLLKLLLLILYTFPVFAQEVKITGSIKNTSNQPVSYVNIVVTDTAASPNPISFTSSDGAGNFSLQIPLRIMHVLINVTAVGYAEKTIALRLDTIQPIIMYLETSTTLLKEIVVKGKSFTDTLNLGIDSMNLSKDATLREILNKTDGMVVSKEGGISFQGKQINKVLINGKEVFVGQNKVALDNLNYEIMDNVQVITNYRDKFTIDFNRIQDPVINIKTKSVFKGVAKTRLETGYGFKNSYSLNARGFLFSDKLNAFVTSNTNNTGQKELSQKDVTAMVNEHASDWLTNALSPLFIENLQMKKNFASNSSLTFRWQGNKSKSGIVFYYGNIRTERETDYTTFLADTLLKKSNQKNTVRGNFLSSTVNYSHLVSPKTILQNVLNVITVQKHLYKESIDTQFVPSPIHFMERTSDAPKSFTIANALKLTKLLNDNTALDINLNYYHENSTGNFETRLVNSNTADIFQQGTFSRDNLSAIGNVKFRLRGDAALNTGIFVTQNNESGRLSYQQHMVTGSALQRNITTVALPVSLQGSIGKLDYNFLFTPVLIDMESSGKRRFLKISHLLTYNFEAQNNLILGLSRNYRFFGLTALFDTVVQTYNYKIINNKENINELSTREEISFSWFNTNVARSKMTYVTYRFSLEKHLLQSVFDSVSANVFYYTNRIFDKKQTHTLNAGARKSFYLEPAYNRLDIGGGIMYTANVYTTILNSRTVQASGISWEPTLTLGFAPRNYWIKEVAGRAKWNNQLFNIDTENITRQSILTNTLTIESSLNKIEGKVDVEYLFYNVNKRRFNVPDLNLSLKYNLSEKVAFSIVGKSVLTLFRLNNYAFINTLSDGNTLTQIATYNNLGYLLSSVTLKF